MITDERTDSPQMQSASVNGDGGSLGGIKWEKNHCKSNILPLLSLFLGAAVAFLQLSRRLQMSMTYLLRFTSTH